MTSYLTSLKMPFTNITTTHRSRFLPAPIRMTLNDLECPIHLNVRLVDGTFDVRLLRVSDSTIRIHVARGGGGEWAGGPSLPIHVGSWRSVSLRQLSFLLLLCNRREHLSKPLTSLAHHPRSTFNSLNFENHRSLISYFDTYHLTCGINFLAHFVNHVLISLFLIHCSFIIISAHLRPHHFHHISHLLSFVHGSKHFFFRNLFLHKPMTPSGLL